MKIHTNILRSKVARRIFLLFLACSMLPVVILTVITSRMMTTHLEEQGLLQLQQRTKSIGMIVLGRLSQVEMELRTISMLDLEDEPRASVRWSHLTDRLGDRFRSVGVVTEGGIRSIVGDASLLAAFPVAARVNTVPGRVTLATVRGPGDSGPSLLLGLALEAGVGSARELVAEISPDYIWHVGDEIDLPSDTELSILDSTGRTLFTTTAHAEDPSAKVLRDRVGAHGAFRWSTEDREHQGHSWPVFLKPRYGCPGWTVVVTQPTGGVLASISWASKLLPLTILVCVLFVALLSLVQIRRSLVPIVNLGEGTRRIAAGQFDARVKAETNDEFAELADSFNGMADRLGAQFHALTTMADIDRELLSVLDEQQIVDTLLLQAPDRLRCDRAALLLDRLDGAEGATIHTRGQSESDRAEISLQCRHGQWIDELEGRTVLPSRLPHVVADALGPGLERCHVVPLRRDGLNGCMILGSRRSLTWTTEELIEARRLVNQAGVALSNARLVQQLERANRETLHALARAVDANSPWTAGHSERVTGLSLELARCLGVDSENLAVLHRGGLLHDVGKIGVPGHIVDKPGRLTEEERAQMQDHVCIGARILEPISGYRREIPIVRHHHECYDGTGYPDGLASEGIPYLARVLAVADVFDALISDRPYRQGWELRRVVEYLRDGAGTLFDPAVVSAFLKLVDDGVVDSYSRGEEPCVLQSATTGVESLLAARS